MGSFKEAGSFQEPSFPIPDHLRKGGVNLKDGYSIKHRTFRLRPIGQQDTKGLVSKGDIIPIKLHPGDIKKVCLPKVEEVNMGAELEFTVLNPKGVPVSLYGTSAAIKENGKIDVQLTNERWLIDDLEMSPEGLRFQAELNIAPGKTVKELERNMLQALEPSLRKCGEEGLLLLPTGLAGHRLDKSWSNVAPHPYIVNIQDGLKGSAIDFDACTVQVHVDLSPFGKIAEFALHIGNTYNALLASMFNAIATSAPFSNGEITQYLSNREQKRNNLITIGGVQANIPVNANLHLARGDRLIRAGKIPVPERAGSYRDNPGNGSHKDFRPKYSTGTAEFGATDMSPNIDFWIAQMIILRQFVWAIAESIRADQPIPDFLANNSLRNRVYNRNQASQLGNQAVFRTSSGDMTTREAWTNFLTWIKPHDPNCVDWQFSVATIMDMLKVNNEAINMEKYYTHMQGNVAVAMIHHSRNILGCNEQRIRETNLAVAQGFTTYLTRKIDHARVH